MKTMPTTSEEETSIDSDWVKQFLEMSDEELSEVVVVAVDDDDDCVVLDGDPENQVNCDNDTPTGSDEEILVVGEKGQGSSWNFVNFRDDLHNFRLHAETILILGIFVAIFLILQPLMRDTVASATVMCVTLQHHV